MSHKYLILGLLAEQPMTGYDIRKHVKDVLSAVTSTSYGTLYPALHKMLKEGSVEVQEIPQKGRPAKKVYRITPQGQRDFTTWLKRVPESDKVKREFLLKLYFAQHLSDADVLKLVSRRRSETEAALNLLCTDDANKTASKKNGKAASKNGNGNGNGNGHSNGAHAPDSTSAERDAWIRDYMLTLYKAEMEWLARIELNLTRPVPVTT